MTSIIKRQKKSMVLVAIIVLSAILMLVAAPIQSDQFAFAHYKKGYKVHQGKSFDRSYKPHTEKRFNGISQQADAPQQTLCINAGGDSSITEACNNIDTTTTTNKGGVVGLGGYHNKGNGYQDISQHADTPQKAVCINAGGDSSISGSCNNTATITSSNSGGVVGISRR